MNNLESLKDIIENYSEELQYLSSSEIEKFQALLEDIRNNSKTIWDLKIENSKEYYHLNWEGGVVRGAFNHNIDKQAREIGNAFLTKEEAEFELERRKVEAVMRKYSSPYVEDEENYCILYLHDEKRVDIGYYSVTDYGIPHFKTEEIAQKVIDEIGRDRLKKHWFGVE